MKNILKKLIESVGYKITKKSNILLLNDNPFIAVKKNISINNPIFFDVGANLGQTIKKVINNYKEATIFAFEPSKKCFEFLKSEFRNDKVFLHNLAMGSVCGSLEFNEYSWSALNSVLKRSYGTAVINQTYSVEVSTIDAFCNSNDIKHINFLKTDTEGYELNVLKGASSMMEENRIQFVFVEIFFNENYIGQSSFGDIYNFLLENRFELIRFYDVLYTNEGLASKTDALFVNKGFKSN
ncbi:FkbM family methyltransferase [Flavisericum labens]|uniref:FkbM family methyltransferase n=1 Tax=Flavisericum labens TaxID=3377112 RepID=UPI00387B9718